MKKSLSHMIENCLIWREKAKINFGESGGSTAVSSQFDIVPPQSNCHVFSQSCNFLFS